MYSIIYNPRDSTFERIPLPSGKRSKFCLDLSYATILNVHLILMKPSGCVLQTVTTTSYHTFYIDCSIKERNRLKF